MNPNQEETFHENLRTLKKPTQNTSALNIAESGRPESKYGQTELKKKKEAIPIAQRPPSSSSTQKIAGAGVLKEETADNGRLFAFGDSMNIL